MRLHELRLGYKDIMNQTSEDLKLTFGFEVEVAVENDYRWESHSSYDYVMDKFKKFAPEFNIAKEAYTDPEAIKLDYTKWNVVNDESIKPQGGEIISPVYSNVEEGIDDLLHVFQLISTDPLMYTTASTGLHINIGNPNWKGAQNIDLLKLFLFIGESYLLEKFGRSGNTFAAEVLPKLAEIVKDNNYMSEYESIIEKLNNFILKDAEIHIKYRTVNVKKLREHGYIEFRIIGNENYHTKTQEIVQTIMRYTKVLAIACNKDAARKDYLSKLYQLITNFDKVTKINPQFNYNKYRNIAPPREIELLLNDLKSLLHEDTYDRFIKLLDAQISNPTHPYSEGLVLWLFKFANDALTGYVTKMPALNSITTLKKIMMKFGVNKQQLFNCYQRFKKLNPKYGNSYEEMKLPSPFNVLFAL